MEELKPIILNPPLNPTLVTDGAGLEKLQDFFKRTHGQSIGWDKETPPIKDFYWRRDRTWQVGNTDEQYVVDLLAFVDGDSDLLYDCQGEYGKNMTPKLKPVIDVFTPVLCSNNWLKVGVNLAFEYVQSYFQFGMRPWHFYSADMVERVIVAGAHSLKDYEYFSMAAMMGRYFKVHIDKTLQESFNLKDPLTEAQIYYAALDTRLPLALQKIQAKIIKSDGLEKVAIIENNAIGAFQDMHIHGQRLNTDKLLERDKKNREALAVIITDLDKDFLPVVGSKRDVITEEQIAQMDKEWKDKRIVSDEELKLKAEIRKEKDPERKADLGLRLVQLETVRLAEKDRLKKLKSEVSKRRTKINKLLEKCEGEALINYGSNAQLYEVLKTMKGLKALKSTNDDDLIKFNHIPVIQTLRKFRELSKQVSTYGVQFTRQWVNGPSKDEGFLHPGDNRLHPVFNQLDAATGRSTSEKPNGQNFPQDPTFRSCFECDPPDADEPEGYCIVTADMSGAELRIIAEEANATTWIEAFRKKQDVHSVGTELLYPEEWPSKTFKSVLHPEGWTVEEALKEQIPVIIKGKEKTINPCLYYAKYADGSYAKLKCDCPEHKPLRDGNKSTNFLLAYGGGPPTLAERLGITVEEAEELMKKHAKTFPDVWAYLDRSGKEAKIKRVAYDMFGRRRLFPEPTRDRALAAILEEARGEEGNRWEKCMRKDTNGIKWDFYVADVVAKFEATNNRKPKKEELWLLTHNDRPAGRFITAMQITMQSRIERQGKNHPIQGANASIVKLAMGCGFDEKEGKPYLWHILPKYKARLLALIHDELVVQCPKRFAEQVKFEIGDAFRRAAAERMTKVVMEFDCHIAPFWKK